MKKRPSVLDSLTIASPCQQSWDSMPGNDRIRHCGNCKKPVHDLGRFTRTEAEKLLSSVGPDGHAPCVRFGVDAKGRVVTAPPHGTRWFAAALAFAMSLFVATRGESNSNEIMGGAPYVPAEFKAQEKAPAPTPVPTPKTPKKKKR